MQMKWCHRITYIEVYTLGCMDTLILERGRERERERKVECEGERERESDAIARGDDFSQLYIT